MDEQEQKDTQDMVVGSDGSMNDSSDAGQKIEVKTSDTNDNTESQSETPETTSSVETSEPMNEVAPPPLAEPTEPSDTEQSDIGSDSVEVKQPPTEEENSAEQTDNASKLNQMAQNEAEKSSDSSMMNSAAIAPAVAAELHGQKQSIETPQKTHEHRNNKKLAVITTLVVAVLLAGGAIYMYMSTQNNTKEADRGSNQAESTEDLPNVDNSPATADDVDQAAQEAEEAINALDDASDFSEESLSDQNLGIE